MYKYHTLPDSTNAIDLSLFNIFDVLLHVILYVHVHVICSNYTCVHFPACS